MQRRQNGTHDKFTRNTGLPLSDSGICIICWIKKEVEKVKNQVTKEELE